MRKGFIFTGVILSGLSTITSAELAWQQCESIQDTGFLPYVENYDESEVDVKADDAQLVENGTSVFTGDVIVIRGGQELQADRATYNQISGDITAQGNIQIRDSEIILNAQQAEWALSNDEGKLVDADYRLRESHARGSAKTVYRQGIEKTILKNATYTTCNVGDNAWLLEASKVNLDHVNDVGVARNVKIRLAGVPVFYTPYLSFPLSDERKSGFLTPSFGNSDENGIDIQTPYYWNISPDKDATFTPRLMSERGLMIDTEFRYLYDRHKGKIDAGFLLNDQLKNDGDILNPYYKEDRKHFSLQHVGYFSSRWNTNIDYNYVSDDNYLEDFGSNLSLASTTHLNRQFSVGYTEDNWSFTGRLQGYQTLTDVDKPYQRLPQLLFRAYFPDQAMGLTYGIKAEYVDFDHADNVAGQRIDIEPSISLPWSSAAAFITPRIALRHTRYDLTDNVTTGIDKTPTRTAPVVSLDSGLFFERAMSLGQGSYIQTLEPRAFYLYVPERVQKDIPVFDSSLRTFNMGQLFAYDRFSGSDRLGDANQLSIALTSRIINQQTGHESFRVSLGQIQYFHDRDVTIDNTAKESDSSSDMIAEIAASLAKEWTVRGEMQWDPRESRSNMSSVRLQYRGDSGGLLNFSHRYRRDNVTNLEGLEQVDISTRLPINKQWSIIGRWYRSLKESQTLETLVGIEYDSCCWATRLVVRDYVNNALDDDRNLAIFFQIELKGLGNFGQKTDSLLEKSILGYDPDF
ncbi:MAG: LPS assembly protein LptD [Methylophaga sp.]|nr:LPS assembly protein LptD [Methylophaga sp.]